MSKQDLQLLNIGVDTSKRADNQLALDIERELFRHDRISELNELEHDDPDLLQPTDLIEEDHHVVLAYLLPNKIKNLKVLPKEDKARLNTAENTKTMAYRYIPVFDISQTGGEPALTARDLVKDRLTANHESVTILYNELKGYLNRNTDLKVSEKPLTGLDGTKGYLRKDANEIVISGDESNNRLKLKTLYHEFAHNQLRGLNAEYDGRPRSYKETRAKAVVYVAMQNIEIDTGEHPLGYVTTWTEDKEVIHNALSEIQSISKEAIDIIGELTQKLGLQEEQKESDNLKVEAEQEATSENKQPANSNSKSLGDRVQARLNELIEQNPDTKKLKQEQAQKLKM